MADQFSQIATEAKARGASAQDILQIKDSFLSGGLVGSKQKIAQLQPKWKPQAAPATGATIDIDPNSPQARANRRGIPAAAGTSNVTPGTTPVTQPATTTFGPEGAPGAQTTTFWPEGVPGTTPTPPPAAGTPAAENAAPGAAAWAATPGAPTPAGAPAGAPAPSSAAKTPQAEQQAVLNNLKEWEQYTPEKFKSEELFRDAYDYDNASPEKKKVMDAYWQNFHPSSDSYFANLAQGIPVYNAKNTSKPEYIDAQQRYNQAKAYANNPQSLADDIASGKVITGSQAWNDLNAIDPTAIKKAKDMNAINGVHTDSAASVTNVAEGIISSADFKEATSLDSFEAIKAKLFTPDVTQLEEEITKRRSQIEAIDAELAALEDSVDEWGNSVGASAFAVNSKKAIMSRTLLAKRDAMQWAMDGAVARQASILDTNIAAYNQHAQQENAIRTEAYSLYNAKFESDLQVKQEGALLAQQAAYKYGDVSSKDPMVRKIAVENAVNDVLAQFKGMPMTRSQAQMVEDVTKLVDGGMSLGAAISQNITTPITQKPEYTQWKNTLMGAPYIAMGGTQYYDPKTGKVVTPKSTGDLTTYQQIELSKPQINADGSITKFEDGKWVTTTPTPNEARQNLLRKSVLAMLDWDPTAVSGLSAKDQLEAQGMLYDIIEEQKSQFDGRSADGRDQQNIISSGMKTKIMDVNEDTIIKSAQRVTHLLQGASFDEGASAFSAGGPIIKALNDATMAKTYDKKVAAFSALTAALGSDVARGLFGEKWVLTDQDIERYKVLLPNQGNTPNVNEMLKQYLIQTGAYTIKSTIANAAKNKNVYKYLPDYQDALRVLNPKNGDTLETGRAKLTQYLQSGWNIKTAIQKLREADEDPYDYAEELGWIDAINAAVGLTQ